MKDKEFLQWIHERLVHVHNENELMDYMYKLRSITDNMDKEAETPNICYYRKLYISKEDAYKMVDGLIKDYELTGYE